MEEDRDFRAFIKGEIDLNTLYERRGGKRI